MQEFIMTHGIAATVYLFKIHFEFNYIVAASLFAIRTDILHFPEVVMSLYECILVKQNFQWFACLVFLNG